MNAFQRLNANFVILLFAGLVASTIFLAGIDSKSKEIESNWLPSAVHLSHLNTLTSDFRILELQHILSTSDGQMSSYEKQMTRKSESIKEEMNKYEPLITTELEKQLYADFASKWKEYLQQNHIVLNLSRENRNNEATTLIGGRSESLFNDFSNTLLLLVNENKLNASKESEAGSRLFLLSLLNLLFMTTVMGIFIYKISKYVKSQFDRIVQRCIHVMAEKSIG